MKSGHSLVVALYLVLDINFDILLVCIFMYYVSLLPLNSSVFYNNNNCYCLLVRHALPYVRAYAMYTMTHATACSYKCCSVVRIPKKVLIRTAVLELEAD